MSLVDRKTIGLLLARSSISSIIIVMLSPKPLTTAFFDFC
jgi:hypothetical protein